MQIVEEPGRYKFALTMLTAHALESRPVEFEMKLPFMDNRAFTSGSGSLPLYQPDWQAASAKA